MKQHNAPRAGMDRLADYLMQLGGAPLSREVKYAARLCLLDALGCGIYSSAQPEARGIARAARAACGEGAAPVWGMNGKLSMAGAAFACGSLCHLRELDDVHYAILHTGAVCVPAAVSAAMALPGTTFGRLLESITLGVEAMARVSLGMDYLRHRSLGWHGTATCGAFGAAATAGWLLQLEAGAFADALGIAGSRTGGTWAFSQDGAMSKRLHPGLAAMDGLLAAQLAAQGISGPRYVLEAEDGGFYRVAAGEDFSLDALDTPTQRLAVQDVEFKWFASCKSVHSPLSAALELHERFPGRSTNEVERITVEVNASALSMAGRLYEKKSVVSAQLSIPYGVALGLLGRGGQAEDYTPQALCEEAVWRLAEVTEVIRCEEFDLLRSAEHKSGARVTVFWRGGETAHATVTEPKGSLAAPLTEADISNKFIYQASGVLGKRRACELRRFVLESAENIPARGLATLLLPRGGRRLV